MQLSVGEQERTYGGVRAYKRAFGALHAFVRIPLRHPIGDAPPLESGGAHGHTSVGFEQRHRQRVASKLQTWRADLAYKFFERGIPRGKRGEKRCGAHFYTFRAVKGRRVVDIGP